MIEKLFGIKALENCFNITLSAHNIALGPYKENWRNKNIQPKRKINKNEKLIRGESEYGICPHYEFIGLCADIMGIRSDELARFDYFCGLLVKQMYLHKPMSFPSRKVGDTLIPFRCCAAINDLMSWAIKLAKLKRPRALKKMPDFSSPSEEDRERMKKFFAAYEKFEVGQKILEFWREIVPKNIGMRSIRYSKTALISAVEKLVEQLKERATGRDTIFVYGAPCPLAPRYEHDPWVYIN